VSSLSFSLYLLAVGGPTVTNQHEANERCPEGLWMLWLHSSWFVAPMGRI